MLRTVRTCLCNASIRCLPKTPVSTAPFTTCAARRTKRCTRWQMRARPAILSSTRLIALTQQSHFSEKKRDPKLEKQSADKKLKSHPNEVPRKSSGRPSVESKASDGSTMDGVKADLNVLKDTLSLGSVPALSYKLGFAGTLPYLGTSVATTYLSWNLNTTWPSQSQLVNHFLMSHESAAHYLHLLEPIQIGYGAVIISFLGAIHWGLEYAEKQPNRARQNFRYGLGVLAPVIAWPTIIMPVQYALTAQFAAFTFMYFADARATTRGWAPAWYGTYRFVLTAIVGLSIFISLIGREKVGSDQPRLTGLREKFHKEGHDAGAEAKWRKVEAEEKEKARREKEEEKQGTQEENRSQAEEDMREEDDGTKDGAKKNGDKQYKNNEDNRTQNEMQDNKRAVSGGKQDAEKPAKKRGDEAKEAAK